MDGWMDGWMDGNGTLFIIVILLFFKLLINNLLKTLKRLGAD